MSSSIWMRLWMCVNKYSMFCKAQRSVDTKLPCLSVCLSVYLAKYVSNQTYIYSIEVFYTKKYVNILIAMKKKRFVSMPPSCVQCFYLFCVCFLSLTLAMQCLPGYGHHPLSTWDMLLLIEHTWDPSGSSSYMTPATHKTWLFTLSPVICIL